MLVGLGRIGATYDLNLPEREYILSYARAIGSDSRFEFVAAIDPEISQRKLFSSKYKAPVFSTIEKALLSVKPEIVVVANPTELHEEVIKKLVNIDSVKLIVCEKPLAQNLHVASTLVKLCSDANKRLVVNYMRRAIPKIRKYISRLNDGGEKILVGGIVRYSGGLIHNGSHFIDLMIASFGSMERFKVIRRKKISNNDWLVDVAMFFSGASVYLLSNDFIIDNKGLIFHDIDLYSDVGRLIFRNGAREINYSEVGSDLVFDNVKTYSNNILNEENVMNKFQTHVLNDIYDGYIENKSFLPSGSDSLKSLEVIDKMIGNYYE